MRPIARVCVTAVSAIALSAGFTTAQARADDPDEIFEKVAPATVQVLAGGEADGTGVVYDAEKGLILTNDHVVAGQTSLQVRIEDGGPVPVRVVAADPCEDLAIVKLATPQDDLKEVEFGDSGDLGQGDQVTAIGYPVGAGDASHEKAVLTTGVVQSPEVAQTGQVSSPNLSSTVQHSATLNPGNSGGPLLNSDAKLVGINTFIIEGTQGQYYSIAGDHAKPLLEGLAEGKSKNNPGWQGLVALSDPDFASYFPGQETEATKLQKAVTAKGIDGVYVTSVDGHSVAAKANMAAGDVITDIKDTKVTTVPQVCDVLQSSAPGEKVDLLGAYTSDTEFQDGTSAKAGDTWSATVTLGR
ncbi:S1C family serine protease [Streptomyces krungchingensis]|uniref:S1C family serine protease n=1 Tax=Streptomyces sp. Tue6028 TaxID=2036037 RepID=UPI003D723024